MNASLAWLMTDALLVGAVGGVNRTSPRRSIVEIILPPLGPPRTEREADVWAVRLE
jgi:hypothetical protein